MMTLVERTRKVVALRLQLGYKLLNQVIRLIPESHLQGY